MTYRDVNRPVGRRFYWNPSAFVWLTLGGLLSLVFWTPIPIYIFLGLSLFAFLVTEFAETYKAQR